MREVLINFYTQISDAYNASININLPDVKKISNIVICGMGGSAISGDLLSLYLYDEIKIPIFVNRRYDLPNFVNSKSLIFISTYSGNTEETLSCYSLAKKRTKNIICITTGGKLFSFSTKYFLELPKGYQPRCALGWLFIPLIVILMRLGMIKNKDAEIKDSISLLKELSIKYNAENSFPYKLAKELLGKFIIIYSDSKWLGVARRWSAQFNENSKVFSHYNEFSELNHNEIVGFGNPSLPYAVIYLIDKSYNERIKKRFDLSKEIFSHFSNIYEIESMGDSLLARIFSLIYIGDWTSYWLAVLQNIDPTPIERIDWLKQCLQ